MAHTYDVCHCDECTSKRIVDAAPLLLAALRLGMQWSEDDGYQDDDNMLSVGERLFRQAARAAIAKAEGRDE